MCFVGGVFILLCDAYPGIGASLNNSNISIKHLVHFLRMHEVLAQSAKCRAEEEEGGQVMFFSSLIDPCNILLSTNKEGIL